METQNTLASMVDATLTIEKLRVASLVRQSHLTLQGRNDPDTDELFRRLVDLEEYVDGRIAEILKGHPAHGWFSRVKGIGKENIGKVVGQVRVKPDEDNRPYADTVSGLWKFAGFAVDNGRAPKRQSGEKLSYNSRLRSMCWRLGSALLKVGLRKQCVSCRLVVGEGKIKKNNNKCPDCGSSDFKTIAITKFGAYYLKEKDKYYQKYENQGIKVVPATSLPKKEGKRYEPEDMISEGHVHNQALRKMIKLFLSCLWLVWREAEGLPVPKPYPIDKLGHDSMIEPWEMIDRD